MLGRTDDVPVDPDNTNVFVGNLPKSEGEVTVQDLKEAFVSAGSKIADIVEVLYDACRRRGRWG